MTEIVEAFCEEGLPSMLPVGWKPIERYKTWSSPSLTGCKFMLLFPYSASSNRQYFKWYLEESEWLSYWDPNTSWCKTGSYQCANIWWQGRKKREQDPSLRFLLTGEVAMVTNQETGNSLGTWENVFLLWGWWNTRTDRPEKFWSLHLKRHSTPNWAWCQETTL